MENGRIGPPRPPLLLCASPGLCQRDGVRHAHLLYLLCEGSTSIRLNCPKKGYTLNLGPVIPLPALTPSPLPAPHLLQVSPLWALQAPNSSTGPPLGWELFGASLGYSLS